MSASHGMCTILPRPFWGSGSSLLLCVLACAASGCAGDLGPQSGWWYARVRHEEVSDSQRRPHRVVTLELHEGTPGRGIWATTINQSDGIDAWVFLVDGGGRAWPAEDFAEGQWLKVSGTLDHQPVRSPDGKNYLHWHQPPVVYRSGGGPVEPVLRVWGKPAILEAAPATRRRGKEDAIRFDTPAATTSGTGNGDGGRERGRK